MALLFYVALPLLALGVALAALLACFGAALLLVGTRSERDSA
jgi:hypothetical protein